MKFLRKTVVGFTTIAFTAIALTTATYAWFPINSKANVDGVNLSVSGGEGFLVSIDNINYSNDLTKANIIKAILLKYQPDQFALQYNETTGKSDFYSITVTYTKDASGNQVRNVSYDNLATESQISEAWDKIQLLPVTSKDGVSVTDLYSSSATAASGRYIDFSVYFKTTASNYYKSDLWDDVENKNYTYYTRDSEGKWVVAENVNSSNYKDYYLKETQGSFKKATEYKASVTTDERQNDGSYKLVTSAVHYYRLEDDGTYKDVTKAVNESNYMDYYVYDGYVYDIYLNGEEATSSTGTTISPTKFISPATKVNLGAAMKCMENGESVDKAVNSSINVYSSNAIRLSITDESVTTEGEGTLIYELNDYVNGASNYGSYATNYSDLQGVDTNYSTDLDYQYGYQYNAMYTYYSNLKKSATLKDSPLYDKLMDYQDMPHTIKDLTSKDSTTGEYLYNKPITRLLSGAEDGTLVTFRIWLEGWDADCFDGLKDSISTTLSFTSTRIY